MVEIRPFNKDIDTDAVREICIKTAYGGNKSLSKKMQKLTLLSYCDYYIAEETETVFVAIDGNNAPIGYILGSVDYKRFYFTMKQKYLPQMRKISFIYGLYFAIGLTFNRIFAKKYSAHLHIDILDGYQRQGVGQRLIAALEKTLIAQNTNGIFLQTSATNKKACNFYKKTGFRRKMNVFGAVTYVKEFTKTSNCNDI